MKVLILGSGCTICRALERRIRQLAATHQLTVEIGKVTDLQEIMTYKIMMTPGLVIDGEVKSVGVIPKDEQLVAWMKGTAG
jgi:small redox-active disulfide protein 2